MPPNAFDARMMPGPQEQGPPQQQIDPQTMQMLMEIMQASGNKFNEVVPQQAAKACPMCGGSGQC